jgi:hypothetical protein
MPPKGTADIKSALDSLKAAVSALADAFPDIERRFAEADAAESEIAKLRVRAESAEQSAKSALDSLSAMESAVLQSMDAAKEFVFKSSTTLEAKVEMLDLCRQSLQGLKGAGFDIWIPRIGDRIDPDMHVVRGRAKSEFGSEAVADVVTWGYRFPSGAGQSAEVLSGDGSVKRVADEEAPPPKPASKAGIEMVVPDSPGAKPKHRKSKAEDSSLFDQLSEAAKKKKADSD